jgi:hypothetical protein
MEVVTQYDERAPSIADEQLFLANQGTIWPPPLTKAELHLSSG